MVFWTDIYYVFKREFYEGVRQAYSDEEFVALTRELTEPC